MGNNHDAKTFLIKFILGSRVAIAIDVQNIHDMHAIYILYLV